MRSALYQFIYSTALVLLAPQMLFSRKLRALYRGRVGLSGRVRRWRAEHPGRVFWFHVASSGELEQCLPILEELKRRSSDNFLVLSYFSPTAKTAVALEEKRRERAGTPVPWDYADYSPWDLAWSARSYLRALQPAAFIAIHREVWPIILQECERASVGRYLFSSYVPPFSEWRIRLLRTWVAKFQFIGTTSDSSLDFYRHLLGDDARIEVGGDPRIERVLNRKDMAALRPSTEMSALLTDGMKNFVAASIWPEDFKALKAGFEDELLPRTDWRLILVPHEPDKRFVEELRRWLESRGEEVKLWSELSYEETTLPPAPDTHLIVDKVGFLAELYRSASMVFVGGSFRSRVHNVLEPAAYGCTIITGPMIDNSGEATELWEYENGIVVSRNSDEFRQQLSHLLDDDTRKQDLAQNAVDYLASRRDAPRFYADRLLTSPI